MPAYVCVSAEDRTHRALFHSPGLDARVVADMGSYLPVDSFTLCMWIRTTDEFGALASYSSPSNGLEWALRIGDVNTGDNK